MFERLSALREILRPWYIRAGAACAAVPMLFGAYDACCNQFGWPKIPRLWGMTGSLLPWWGWLLILQAVFVFGLFEYVRRLASIVTKMSGAASLSEDEPRPEPPLALIPFAALRELAPECGIPLPRFGLGMNNAYYVEEAMGQAAVRGHLKVEGRRYRGDVKMNDFLVPIPPEHFNDFGFGHGVLGYDVQNDQSHTGDITTLGKARPGIKDVTYYDLYVSESDARKVLAELGKDSKIGRP